MFKKLMAIILVYMMSIPIQYIPYIQSGVLHAKKFRVTLINLDTNGKEIFSKRIGEFLSKELKGKNRIDFFNHNVIIDSNKNTLNYKKDTSLFKEVAEIKEEISMQKQDKEYSMLIESWTQVIELYEENFHKLDDISPLFEAYLNKSFYEELDELEDAAKADMKTAISIGRNQVFNPKSFSPRFFTKYQRARKRSKKKAKGKIIVQAPATYNISLDGVYIGKAPLTITKLYPGKHFLVARESGKVVHKQIIILSKKKKAKKIKLKKAQKLTQKIPSTKEALLLAIKKTVRQKIFNKDLKNLLDAFSKKIGADFIVFGNTHKKLDLHKANLYLYNNLTKEIAFLTNGEFDDDLLTGDVESLRIGKEVVKGVDNYSTLDIINLNEALSGASMKTIAFVPYKTLDFSKVKEEAKPIKTVVKPENKNTKQVKNQKDIDISNADYTKLDDETDLDLNKYDDDKPKAKKDSGEWYSKWWVWTTVGIIVAGATAGTVFILTQGEESNPTTTPSGTW